MAADHFQPRGPGRGRGGGGVSGQEGPGDAGDGGGGAGGRGRRGRWHGGSEGVAGAPIASLQQIGKAADEETKGSPKGYEVSYELFSINGRMLGQGDPIRVKIGERVLFHVLNASATEIRSLALPGHLFRVVALAVGDHGECVGV